jgi:hypothetical protein
MGLSWLVEHNIKGAKLLKDGIAKTEDIVAHNEMLRQILTLLSPIFGLASDAVRAWLASNYMFLVPVYDWAKDVIVSFFGL